MSFRAIYASTIFAFVAGCGSSASPQSFSPAPSAASPDGGGADGGPAACGGTIDEFCASGSCPKTWAEAQVAARGWCTTPPAGVDFGTVAMSMGSCATGYLTVSVGEFGGPTYYYDAATTDLVAVYTFSDVAPPSCVAGTPIPSTASICAGGDLCSYGVFLDGGTFDDASDGH